MLGALLVQLALDPIALPILRYLRQHCCQAQWVIVVVILVLHLCLLLSWLLYSLLAHWLCL